MEFEKLITERFSVRRFINKHLSQDVIEKILEATNKAPTGCNNQPQRILVLNTDESMDKLRICTKCHFNAPTAMLVCHNRDESWKRPYDGVLSSPVDAAIVSTYRKKDGEPPAVMMAVYEYVHQKHIEHLAEAHRYQDIFKSH